MEAGVVELPRVRAGAPESKIDRAEWLKLASRAKRLSWISLFIITLEGVVGITAGIIAGSAALIGFGLDSVIEGVASLVIVWRFTGSRLLSRTSEDRAQKLVAIQFFLLAPYVAYEGMSALLTSEHPDASYIGIGLAVVSLITMPYLGRAKEKIGDQMGSLATKGEGQQNMLCAYMAAALLVGLGGNAVFGIWWLDPIAALFIAAVALREGIETWRGEGCCAPSEHPAMRAPVSDSCGCGCEGSCTCC
jgi:divalent metal cation (Fe/Co/Zn/Cd) transporter